MTAPDSRDSVERVVAEMRIPHEGGWDNDDVDALADRLQALARGPQQAPINPNDTFSKSIDGPQQAGGEDVLRCSDCGTRYRDFSLDVVLSDEQWMSIYGRDGGVLCAACIVERGSRLPGVTVAKLYFPDLSDPVSALQAEVARLQRERAELIDKLNGTPCAEVRWQQERERLQAALREAGRDAEDAKRWRSFRKTRSIRAEGLTPEHWDAREDAQIAAAEADAYDAALNGGQDDH